MYLWHFPLFIFLDNARTGLTGYPLFGVRVAVTLAVATVSFYCLERPLRQGTMLKGWRGLVASPVAVGAVVATLLAATTAPALAAQPPPRRAAPRALEQNVVYTRQPLKVLWVGDSAAFTLAIALSAQQSSYGIESFDGAILGCGVTDGTDFQLKGADAPMATACSGSPSGDPWPRRWLTDIADYKPNVVMILAGRWEVVNRTYHGQWTDIENPTYAAYVKQQLEYAVQIAGSGGARVIVLTAPCYDTGEQPNGDPWPEDSRTRLSIYNDIVRQVVATSADASLINFNAIACPGSQYEEFMDGVQVRQPDGVHFALGGGTVFAARFWPLVVALGSRQLALAHDRWQSPRG